MFVNPVNHFSYINSSFKPNNNSRASSPNLPPQKPDSVSFTSSQKSQNKQNIIDALLSLGFVGAPLIISVAAYKLMDKTQDPNQIFLPDGTFFMNTKDMTISSDNITADADSGLLKIKNAGIDLDPDRFDLTWPKQGVYKNFDGSVDIDLLNNKYIDRQNGIFIDPDHKISAILSQDGTFHNIVLPDEASAVNFDGASLSDNIFHKHNLTRSEYIEQFGHAPEDDPLYKDFDVSAKGYRITDPDDNRSYTQKIIDFLNPLTPDARYNNLYDKSKQYDIFGREILTIHDSSGITRVAVDENFADTFSKYNFSNEDLGKLAQYFNEVNLKNYIIDYEPDFAKFVETPHLEDFLSDSDLPTDLNIDYLDIDDDADEALQGWSAFFKSLFQSDED